MLTVEVEDPTIPKVLCIVQRPQDYLGHIESLHSQGQYRLERCYPSEGDSLPDDLTPYKAVMICGGSMSVNDEHLPAIRAQLAWIPKILDSGIPVLGICLGGQLLAKALGATVQTHTEARVDIGYVPIQPTSSGSNIFPKSLHTYHWNQEGFDLPAGATRLAMGDTFPNQAFRYGNAYGIQFHPEITLDMIQQWTQRSSHMLERPGAHRIEHQLAMHEEHEPSIKTWFSQFIDQHLLLKASV